MLNIYFRVRKETVLPIYTEDVLDLFLVWPAAYIFNNRCTEYWDHTKPKPRCLTVMFVCMHKRSYT